MLMLEGGMRSGWGLKGVRMLLESEIVATEYSWSDLMMTV